MSELTTASQTVGPFVSISFASTLVDDLALPGVAGERVVVRGRVIDGDGAPVSQAAIEIWQANSHGKYAHPEDCQEKPLESEFRGFLRVMTDELGAYRLTTIKPGCTPGPAGVLQAPHLVVVIFMRGLLKQLATRVYFPGDPRNADDPVLKLVPVERRATLIAQPVVASAHELEWNIVLQGKDETVFFDY